MSRASVINGCVINFIRREMIKIQVQNNECRLWYNIWQLQTSLTHKIHIDYLAIYSYFSTHLAFVLFLSFIYGSFYDVVKLQNANNVFTHSTSFGLKLIILYTVCISEGFVFMYSLKCIKILHSSIPNIQLMSEFKGEFKLPFNY